jgi:hypothetical protein
MRLAIEVMAFARSFVRQDGGGGEHIQRLRIQCAAQLCLDQIEGEEEIVFAEALTGPLAFCSAASVGRSADRIG